MIEQVVVLLIVVERFEELILALLSRWIALGGAYLRPLAFMTHDSLMRNSWAAHTRYLPPVLVVVHQMVRHLRVLLVAKDDLWIKLHAVADLAGVDLSLLLLPLLLC